MRDRRRKPKPKRDFGLSVNVADCGGNFEKALRIFKKKVTRTKLIKQVRENQFYEKPSAKKQRKKSAAVRRQQKLVSQQRKPK